MRRHVDEQMNVLSRPREEKAYTMLTVTALFKVRRGQEPRMKEIIEDVTHPSLLEDGCIDYHWAKGENDPTQFLLYMNWRDRAAFDAHVQSVHVKRAEQQIATLDLLAEPAIETHWRHL